MSDRVTPDPDLFELVATLGAAVVERVDRWPEVDAESAEVAAVDHADKAELMTEFQMIKGVGPYTAAIIASHAVPAVVMSEMTG